MSNSVSLLGKEFNAYNDHYVALRWQIICVSGNFIRNIAATIKHFNCLIMATDLRNIRINDGSIFVSLDL
jgi:hypothetical protein